jgi:hypothetical protein
MAASAHTTVGAPVKLTGQAQPVCQLTKQRRADVTTDAHAIGHDFEPASWVGSLHPQGDPPGRWIRPSDSRILLVGRVPCYPAPSLPIAHAK